jgi:hypothetical protein
VGESQAGMIEKKLKKALFMLTSFDFITGQYYKIQICFQDKDTRE